MCHCKHILKCLVGLTRHHGFWPKHWAFEHMCKGRLLPTQILLGWITCPGQDRLNPLFPDYSLSFAPDKILRERMTKGKCLGYKPEILPGMCPHWSKKPSKDLVWESRSHSMDFLSCRPLQPPTTDRKGALWGCLEARELVDIISQVLEDSSVRGLKQQWNINVNTTCKVPPILPPTQEMCQASPSSALYNYQLFSSQGNPQRLRATSRLTIRVNDAPWGYMQQGPWFHLLPSKPLWFSWLVQIPLMALEPLPGVRE